ncbi:MAG: hypothetical protein SFY81_04110 [Verrucomicrobiota bacterium]|nr:hypothetical protein [Verrucomicrobiota bacterium]
MNDWFLLPLAPGPAAWNMAFDETLLNHLADWSAPVLRFYSWEEPAATFGYFQHYRDIAEWTALRPLIRRPTGGGLVRHDADWTYSIAVPPEHPWYSFRAEESYRHMHEWIARAFDALGVRSNLSPCCDKEIPGQCFIGAEKYDLLVNGKKIAGAAQRRNKLGLLIQGSIQQQPGGLLRDAWEREMLTSVDPRWEVSWKELKISDTVRNNVTQLAATKYSQRAYNEKR